MMRVTLGKVSTMFRQVICGQGQGEVYIMGENSFYKDIIQIKIIL